MAVRSKERMTEDEAVTEKEYVRASISDLPPELLSQVLWHLPRKASVANALCGVCKEWRQAILNEDVYLRQLHFVLDANQPFRGMSPVKGAVAHRRTWEHVRKGATPELSHSARSGTSDGRKSSRFFGRNSGARIPEILIRSADTGVNVSAIVTLGMLQDLRGNQTAANMAWKRAALLGSGIAQFKLGEIHYRGSGNQGVDGEEALFWLSKAVKNRDAPIGVTSLATAAGIIGFLHLDGEGTQAYNVTAVKWFKVAAENGNLEALKTLGWLYNTGQF